MKRLLVPSLLASLALTGCQSNGRDPVDPAPATQAALEQTHQDPPARPIGIDDDSAPITSNPITDALLAPINGLTRLSQAIGDLSVQAYQFASGDTAARAARMLTDSTSPDNRRAGINRLLEFKYTRRRPYTTAYEIMAQEDADPTVRAAALRACNQARDRSATPIFIKALSDGKEAGKQDAPGSELVRLEAAKGLANLPDPNAATPLVKLVTDATESRDVRIAAVDALKYYRTVEVARALSGLVNDRDFSIAWQARRSLAYMTNHDFGYDEAAWLSYFSGPGRPLG